jgi:hypothetical protein
MTERVTEKSFTIGMSCLILLVIVSVIAKSSHGQSNREAEGARMLKGAIDMHFDIGLSTSTGNAEHKPVRRSRDEPF